MLKNEYQEQEEVSVKVLRSFGVNEAYRSKRAPFEAKVVRRYGDAIAVIIDQWWIFFDLHGRQYGEYPELAKTPEFELF